MRTVADPADSPGTAVPEGWGCNSGVDSGTCDCCLVSYHMDCMVVAGHVGLVGGSLVSGSFPVSGHCSDVSGIFVPPSFLWFPSRPVRRIVRRESLRCVCKFRISVGQNLPIHCKIFHRYPLARVYFQNQVVPV